MVPQGIRRNSLGFQTASHPHRTLVVPAVKEYFPGSLGSPGTLLVFQTGRHPHRTTVVLQGDRILSNKPCGTSRRQKELFWYITARRPHRTTVVPTVIEYFPGSLVVPQCIRRNGTACGRVLTAGLVLIAQALRRIGCVSAKE